MDRFYARLDRRFVDLVDRLVRPLTTLTGRDEGAIALALAVTGAAVVVGTVTTLVHLEAPTDLVLRGIVVATLGGVTAVDVWLIRTQVRAARRAAADGLLVTDPHSRRRLIWFALPLLVAFNVPVATTAGLALGAILVAAAYAAAGRCRPAGRRGRRSAWVRGLAGAGA